MRNVAICAAACRTNSILQQVIAKLRKPPLPMSDSHTGKAGECNLILQKDSDLAFEESCYRVTSL